MLSHQTLSHIPDSKPQPFLQQLIVDTHTYPSAVISVCGYDSGGCHSFGKDLSKVLQCDHIELAMQPAGNFLKSKIEQTKAYQNVILTGCKIIDQDGILTSVQEKYDIEKVKKINFITPPWVLFPEEKYERAKEFLKARHTQYDLTFMTSGIDRAASYCIGLPNPLPDLSLRESKEITPKNGYGLLYIRELLPNETSDELLQIKAAYKHRPIVYKSIIKSIYAMAEKFLNVYFTQIQKLAAEKSELSPSVIFFTQSEIEKKWINEIAKKYNISMIYYDRLPQENFVRALKEIRDKQGLVGCNGAHTFLQANSLKCHSMFYANKPCNADFVKHLVSLMPSDLQAVAEVILGLTGKANLLRDTLKVAEVYRLLNDVISESVNQFERSTRPSKPLTEKTTIPIPEEKPLSVEIYILVGEKKRLIDFMDKADKSSWEHARAASQLELVNMAAEHVIHYTDGKEQLQELVAKLSLLREVSANKDRGLFTSNTTFVLDFVEKFFAASLAVKEPSVNKLK